MLIRIIVLLLLSLSVSGFKNPVYDNIKTQAEGALRALFRQNVTIGSAGGRILGQIVLKDVVVSSDLKAQTVKINFDTLKLLKNKGDFVSAITLITADNVSARVKRDKNNKINIVDYFVDPDAKSMGPPSLPLSCKIVVNNGRVIYEDPGIYSAPVMAPHSFNLLIPQGELALVKPAELVFSVSAEQELARIKVKGKFNIQNQKYSIDLSAQKLDPKKWGPYVLPLNLKYKNGYADAKIHLANDSLKINAYGALNNSNFKAAGELKNFQKPELDFTVSTQNTDLQELKTLFKDFENIDFSGIGNTLIKIEGPVPALRYAIDLTVPRGTVLRQSVAGAAKIVFAGKKMVLADSNISTCHGRIKSSGWVDFNRSVPEINFNIRPAGLDIHELSYKSIGLSGLLTGELSIFGSAKKYRGKLEAGFENASAFGQSINSISAAFIFDHGNITLDRLAVGAKDSFFKSSGSISSDGNTSLSAEAAGIILSGENFIGKMGAKIKNFNGALAFKLDQDFFKSPLRNISAKGSVEVTDVQIDEQLIDYGSGDIYINAGRLNVNEFMLARKQSAIYIFGETGINTASNLRIIGNKLDLEDLKILNLLLPYSAKNPRGICNLDVLVQGEIKSKTNLASLDPLFDLEYSGTASVTDGKLNGVLLKSARTEFEFKNRRLNIKNAEAISANSKINLALTAEEDRLDVEASGQIDFQDLDPLLAPYGYFEGIGSFKTGLNGENLFLNFDFNSFKFNQTYLGRVKAGLRSENGRLKFHDPLQIESDTEKIELSGSGQLADPKEDSTLNLELKINQSQIKTLLPMSLELIDFFKKISGGEQKRKLKSASAKTVLPNPRDFTALYAAQNHAYLSAWSSIEAEHKTAEKEELSDFWNAARGNLRAGIKIIGLAVRPKFDFDVRVDDCAYKGYKFDSVIAGGSYYDKTVSIKKAEIGKQGGAALVWGELDLGGVKNKVNLQAKNFPADILELAFGKKEYKGNLDLSASVNGRLDNPSGKINLFAAGVELAKIRYDRISAEASIDNGLIEIENCDIKTANGGLSADGFFSINGKEVNLNLEASGEGLGIINLLNEEVYYVSGKNSENLHFSPSLNQLRIEGFVKVENADFEIRKYSSRLVNTNINLLADKDNLTVERFNGYWTGKTTKNRPNLVALAGIYDYSSGRLNFKGLDSTLSLDLANVYSGDIGVKDVTLSGQINNPTLSGKLEFNEGVLYLPEKGKSTNSFMQNVNLDLALNFNKNMYLTSGNMSALDLSNLFLNLEFSGANLIVHGNAARPSLNGQLDFKRGTVAVFNREFELLSETNQKKYYPYDFDKVTPNYARFSPNEGYLPDLNLTAVVIVEDSAKTTSNLSPQNTQQTIQTTTKKQVHILSRIKGIPQAKEIGKGIKIDFAAFTEDNTASPPVMSAASYSDTEVKTLLLPDFVQSIIKQGQLESSSIVADMLASNLQTWVFRDVERKLEKAFGLESLSLQYNFGKDLRRNLGGPESGIIRPLFGFSFVKGFFDKLFVEIKYSQLEDQRLTATEGRSLNYEITYRFLPWATIAYYKEPLTYSGVNTSYYKTTLRIIRPL